MLEQVKNYVIASLLVMWLLSIAFLPNYFREQGAKEAKADFEIEVQRLNVQALEQRVHDNDLLRAKHKEIEMKLIEESEQKYEALEAKYRNNRANNAGLYINKTGACTATATAKAISPTRNNENQQLRLPSRVESGLYDIAERADKVNIQLGMCQAWIRENGFYEVK